MIIYIHGFNSSSQSGKAQELKRWLEERGRAHEWVSPDLPNRPSQAIALLSELIERAATPPKLLGSSLGGFYATHLVSRYDVKAALVNPAVHPGLLLRSLVGSVQQHWHDEGSYTFTQTHLDELTALDQLGPANPHNMLLLLENGDKTLDWRDATSYYRDAHQLVFQGGNHGFTRFSDVLDLIDRF
jgi:predicted esterase YcpF (UPF0227 family)